MAFGKIEKDLESLGFKRHPRRDFVKGKRRVNAIDLSMKLSSDYTMEELTQLLSEKAITTPGWSKER